MKESRRHCPCSSSRSLGPGGSRATSRPPQPFVAALLLFVPRPLCVHPRSYGCRRGPGAGAATNGGDRSRGCSARPHPSSRRSDSFTILEHISRILSSEVCQCVDNSLIITRLEKCAGRGERGAFTRIRYYRERFVCRSSSRSLLMGQPAAR